MIAPYLSPAQMAQGLFATYAHDQHRVRLTREEVENFAATCMDQVHRAILSIAQAGGPDVLKKIALFSIGTGTTDTASRGPWKDVASAAIESIKPQLYDFDLLKFPTTKPRCRARKRKSKK